MIEGISNEDLASAELSLETTVPTDLTVSQSESDENGHPTRLHKHVTKNDLQKKQLSHDIQRLKIELSQKNMIIDNMKMEHMSAIEDLEEKLNETLHQKKMTQAMLENQMRMMKEEMKLKERKYDSEVKKLLERQQHLETVNTNYCEAADEVKQSLDNLRLTESEFVAMEAKDKKTLSIKQYASMMVYKSLRNLLFEKNELVRSATSLKNDLLTANASNQQIALSLQTCEKNRMELLKKHEEAVSKLQETVQNVEQGNFKIENFDRVKKERDALKRLNLELSNQLSNVQANLKISNGEKDDFKSQLNTCRQELNLMAQNKEILAKNVSELTARNGANEDRCADLTLELDKVKQARELLYEKYISSREQHKAEYQRKMEQELDDIRMKTANEIEKIQRSIKDMYEREIRGLKDSSFSMQRAKEHSELLAKDSLSKYEQLLVKLKTLEAQDIGQISELRSELKVKVFQLEQLKLSHHESDRNLESLKKDNEKLNVQNEVLVQEMQNLQLRTNRTILQLESDLKHKSSQLEVYEQLENELDDVVLHSGQVESTTSAEKFLSFYGTSGLVPLTSKRRLEQSMLLARQVLKLKKELSSLQEELDKETSLARQQKQELASARDLLSLVEQPQNIIVEKLRQKDEIIFKRNDRIASMESQIKELNKEKTALVCTKNELNRDLGKLLNNREELSMLKQVFLQMQSSMPFSTQDSTNQKQEPSNPARGISTAKSIHFTKKGKT